MCPNYHVKNRSVFKVLQCIPWLTSLAVCDRETERERGRKRRAVTVVVIIAYR